jgi:hypothetical protein
LTENEETTLSKLLVIVGIPAFNVEKTIARVVLEAQKYAHMVLVCDDGSKDLTGEIATHLGAVLLKHEKNRGYGAAIQTLLRRALELRADVLVILDSDGQHDPAEIPLVMKPIKDGIAEVVLGSRFLDRNGTSEMPLYRQIGIKVITKLSNGSDKKGVTDAQTGFKAYNNRAIQKLCTISENGMGASIELLRVAHKTGLKVCEVPISCRYEKSLGLKTSTKNPVTHGADILMTLVRLTVEENPLTYLGIPGILCLIVGSFCGAWMLNLYAEKQMIVTSVALASLAFILIGFITVSTAVILHAVAKRANRLDSTRKMKCQLT